MAKKPLPAQKADFIEEHLIYEISLMRETYPLLSVPKPWAEHNALIVAFLNASRNLIEFFKDKPSCDFDPRMFTRDSYQLNKRFLGDSILPQINAQISHLTSKRTKVMEDKFGEYLWKKVYEGLQLEIARFERALSPDYAKMWKLKPGATVSAVQSSRQSSSPTLVTGPTGPSGPSEPPTTGPTGPAGPTR